MRRIAAAALQAALSGTDEVAVLDAREEGEFGAGHIFWAVPCPLSRREIAARTLLPRADVPIVCVDDGNDLAERLGAWLEQAGYTDVAVLDGGTIAWRDAGYPVFSGVNVPSKAFGEWVEHHYGTQSVDAAVLKTWLDDGHDERGAKVVVLDSRPLDEFRAMSIPSAVNVPGGELAYRIGDLVPDAETTIVVNCAGRTRSILGAESLRRAGIPNRVLALRNGTMGWELAGYVPSRGRTERFTPGTPASLELAQTRAAAFAQACGVAMIGASELAAMQAEPGRSVYMLDVRDPAEFAAGHRAGSRNAPGGQLVQATDRWIAVRDARIALLDDTGVRANMAASWLRLMGYRDVVVVADGLSASLPADSSGATAPAAELAFRADAATDRIAPASLVRLLGTPGLCIVDLARSLEFRAGHIPGALWGVRSRLDRLRPALKDATQVVVTSPDGVLAALAVPELRQLTPVAIMVLDGGTAAWTGSLDTDRTKPADIDCVDAYLRPYDRNTGIAEAMRDYLAWEVALPDAVARDPTIRFGTPVAASGG